jgi:hypothetical protein
LLSQSRAGRLELGSLHPNHKAGQRKSISWSMEAITDLARLRSYISENEPSATRGPSEENLFKTPLAPLKASARD